MVGRPVMPVPGPLYAQPGCRSMCRLCIQDFAIPIRERLGGAHAMLFWAASATHSCRRLWLASLGSDRCQCGGETPGRTGHHSAGSRRIRPAPSHHRPRLLPRCTGGSRKGPSHAQGRPRPRDRRHGCDDDLHAKNPRHRLCELQQCHAARPDNRLRPPDLHPRPCGCRRAR